MHDRLLPIHDASGLHCRFCAKPLHHTFADLGVSPLSNSYLAPEALNRMEPFFPLRVYVCEGCKLVQLPEHQSPDAIFSDYAYFSSFSDSWLEHAQRYADHITEYCDLGEASYVVEVASNDGYLLKYFKAKNIPILGIEPARNVAEVAQAAGIPTLIRFFGAETARWLTDSGYRADLLLGNNVLGHVPDVNDFVSGVKILLKPNGTATFEFPHLLQLMQQNQFDTIYHEHFSYYSLLAVEQIFAAHGLRLFDVEELATHGGSLRIYARHEADETRPVSPRIEALKQRERDYGLEHMETYHAFGAQVEETKSKLLEFLIAARRAGKKVVGYGAPAKGNTLLNYCGIRNDFIEYTVDRSPHKQGNFLPGSRLPILHPDAIAQTKPDYLLILPWNLRDEIVEQMSFIKEWGCRFVVPIPEVEVLE